MTVFLELESQNTSLEKSYQLHGCPSKINRLPQKVFITRVRKNYLELKLKSTALSCGNFAEGVNNFSAASYSRRFTLTLLAAARWVITIPVVHVLSKQAHLPNKHSTKLLVSMLLGCIHAAVFIRMP